MKAVELVDLKTVQSQEAASEDTLSTQIKSALRHYFSELEDDPVDLYKLVINEIETPLLKTMLRYTNGNQSKAAKILGISRGTLRKKIEELKIY